MLTIAFTGHRPNATPFGYDAEAWNAMREKIAKAIKFVAQRKGETEVTVITGGAQGVDQCAFWAAHDIKHDPDAGLTIKNVLYMPFEGQESRWRDYGPFSKTEYRQMVDAADSVRVCSPVKTGAPKPEISRALMRRNAAMIDDCDILIAVTDIDDKNIPSHGGTANAMRYAQSRGRAIAKLSLTLPPEFDREHQLTK
jgi:uncharacterized phage-like protein YoqJ